MIIITCRIRNTFEQTAEIILWLISQEGNAVCWFDLFRRITKGHFGGSFCVWLIAGLNARDQQSVMFTKHKILARAKTTTKTLYFSNNGGRRFLADRRLFHDNLFNLLPVIKQTASADIRLLGNCRGAWPQKGESVVFVSTGSPASRLLSALISCQRFVFVIRALPKTNSYYLRFISKVFVFLC